MQNRQSPLQDLICFALYSADNAMTRFYQPLLQPLGLTYPQYIVMSVLWADDDQTVGALCAEMGLATSTLTPLLKRLEASGNIVRIRDRIDERQVRIRLTEKGRMLEARANDIPRCIKDATGETEDEIRALTERLMTIQSRLADAN